jgi:hypothetical protein
VAGDLRSPFVRRPYLRSCSQSKERQVDLVMVIVSVGLLAVFASLAWAMEKL